MQDKDFVVGGGGFPFRGVARRQPIQVPAQLAYARSEMTSRPAGKLAKLGPVAQATEPPKTRVQASGVNILDKLLSSSSLEHTCRQLISQGILDLEPPRPGMKTSRVESFLAKKGTSCTASGKTA